MSLYWSVNKNMEIIKNITEVSDVYLMMINGTHMMDIVLKQIQDNYILS